MNILFHFTFIYSSIATASPTLYWSLTVEFISMLFSLAQLALVRIFLERYASWFNLNKKTKKMRDAEWMA